MRVHIEVVDREIVRRQVERRKDSVEGVDFSVADNDGLVALGLELALDEPQQMLVVHRGRVMDVRVNLADVVEIAVRNDLLRSELLGGVEKHMQSKTRLDDPHAMKAERARLAIVDNACKGCKIVVVLLDAERIPQLLAARTSHGEHAIVAKVDHVACGGNRRRIERIIGRLGRAVFAHRHVAPWVRVRVDVF
eukprot:Amastigsp_a842310_27.p3 type:complete len:193 gc:universal Amastigsp_a842310_27:1430-2008(+)